MTAVYILLVIAVKNPTFGTANIDVQTAVFKTAENCLKNAENNKKLLLPKYDQVSTECSKREIN